MKSALSPIPQFQPKKQLIPDKVALNPNPADLETKPYLISFEYYNDSICEIRLLEKHNARRFLRDIRTIGRCNRKNLLDNNIKCKKVYNQGAYKKLFTGQLPQDQQLLYEHEGNGSSRIFYFCVNRCFYVVTITQNHIATHKHR